MNTEKNRYLYKSIYLDAIKSHKMAFISGPRQVGKTTLARALSAHQKQNFFSWDQVSFKKKWIKDPELILPEIDPKIPVVLDEIHKDRRWKQRLKGVYDIHGQDLNLIITGSARLDFYRKGGDSLLGRYLPYRLSPFSVAESENPVSPEQVFSKSTVSYSWRDLLQLGGFPEPLIQGNAAKALRWSRLRLDRILLEDVKDLRNINDIEALRMLTEVLPDTIGSLLSVNRLREDIGVAYATVRSWILVLEALYYGFFVRPFAGKVRRMVRAEPKFYLYDILPIQSEAKKQENLAALHLLKACQFWTDVAEGEFSLHFLRSKDGKEVDFCITKEKKPWMLVECKSGSLTPEGTLKRYALLFKTERNFQLVAKAPFHKHYADENITVMDYETFFSGLV